MRAWWASRRDARAAPGTIRRGSVARADEYQCTGEEVDCGGSACNPNECDPQSGCYATPFEACSPMIYYLPARDTQTHQLIAFRCEVPTDGTSPPVCDTDDAGDLLVFPEQGGACTSE